MLLLSTIMSVLTRFIISSRTFPIKLKLDIFGHVMESQILFPGIFVFFALLVTFHHANSGKYYWLKCCKTFLTYSSYNVESQCELFKSFRLFLQLSRVRSVGEPDKITGPYWLSWSIWWHAWYSFISCSPTQSYSHCECSYILWKICATKHAKWL